MKFRQFINTPKNSILFLLVILQACYPKTSSPSLTEKESGLLPYRNGQDILFVRNSSFDQDFTVTRTVSDFLLERESGQCEEISFSKTEIFPVVSVSTSLNFPTPSNERGIHFYQNAVSPPFSITIPYNTKIELVTGAGSKGDTVKFLGNVRINSVDYQDVFEIKQNLKNTSAKNNADTIEVVQNVVIWYNREKGILRFSFTHLVFRNLTDNSEESIAYFIKE